MQTWGGGRDSGLGGKVAPTEPPPPCLHHRPPPQPPSPQLAPSSEAKRWGGSLGGMPVGEQLVGRAWEGMGGAAGGRGLT